MISSVFIVISLFFSCYCFSFLFTLSCISDQAIFFLFVSFLFRLFFFTFFLIFVVSTQFSSFITYHQHALPLPQFLQLVIFYSFLLLFLSFFLFSSFSFFSLFSSSSYPKYINMMISSIFLVISWERWSVLPHFIHAWIIPSLWLYYCYKMPKSWYSFAKFQKFWQNCVNISFPFFFFKCIVFGQHFYKLGVLGWQIQGGGVLTNRDVPL